MIQYTFDPVIFFADFFLEDRCALYTFWCCTTRLVRSTFNFILLKHIFYGFDAYVVFISHVRSLWIIHLLVLHNCRVLSCSSYLFMCELLYFRAVCDCCAYMCLVFQFLFETVVLHTPFGVAQPWVSFLFISVVFMFYLLMVSFTVYFWPGHFLWGKFFLFFFLRTVV